LGLENLGNSKMTRSKYLAALALLLIVLGSLLIGSSDAKADQPRVTKSFTGFAFEKSVLTLNMKKQITTWIKANPGYSMVSCVGYTGYNVKNRTKAFIEKLAVNRSKTICNYIHSKNGGISVQSTKGIPGKGKTADARKVTVTLIKVDTSGGGNGTVTVGQCDNSLTAVMQSRVVVSTFYFSSIAVRDISVNCKGSVIDIYLLDATGSQLAASMGNNITTGSIRVGYAAFTPNQVESYLIRSVAFEIRDK
jgi:hypothetical protein